MAAPVIFDGRQLCPYEAQYIGFYGAIRQTNMATDSFNIYLSPVGAKSLNRFVINWQAGTKLIRHVRQYNGFVTLNASAIKKRHDVFKRELGSKNPCTFRQSDFTTTSPI